jgi:hypothetical protein
MRKIDTKISEASESIMETYNIQVQEAQKAQYSYGLLSGAAMYILKST